MPTTDVLAYIPITVPRAWVLPIVIGGTALVIALVVGSMFATRRARKKRDKRD